MITEFEFLTTATKVKRRSFHEFEGHGNAMAVEVPIEKLPQNAGFKYCRYRVTLSFYHEKQHFAQKSGDKTVVLPCRGEAFGDGHLFLLFSVRSDTDIGTLNLAPLAMPWVGDFDKAKIPAEPYVRIQITYDPGCTYAQTSFRGELTAAGQDVDYVTTFKSLGVTVDYRGRVIGTDTEQRFPMDIQTVFPASGGLLILLDTDTEGVANPTVECAPQTNVVRVASSGAVDWVAEPVTDDTNTQLQHRYLWRHENRLLTDAGGKERGHAPYIELDPESGAIVDVIEKFPER